MGDRFFVADLHLGHANAINWRTCFSTAEEHDETIIANYNSVVGKRDVTHILGDVAFGPNWVELIGRLNGIKHVILGNHDRGNRLMSKQHLFRRVNGCEAFKIDYILTHIPLHNTSISPRFKYNIHGHTHFQGAPTEQHICVCLEQTGWKPVNWEDIK